MRTDRRRFLAQSLAAAGGAGWSALAGAAQPRPAAAPGVWVNDVHSQLTATRVNRIVVARTPGEAAAGIRDAAKEGRAVCIAGSRHSMGGQPFATDAVMIDTRGMDRVLDFDRERGLITVEAGIRWPQLLAYLSLEQGKGAARGEPRPDPWWTFAQKQTGADDLTLGGCVGANIHGRGLTMKPFISDVESITLLDAAGEELRASRTENAGLFRLAFGGYGLFGLVASLTLRLTPRRPLQRVVELGETPQLMTRFSQRIADGFIYGDFQFAIDENSGDFLRRGVFACYRPASGDEEPSGREREMRREDWEALMLLAHTDKDAAFRRYAGFYLSTQGQVYWSDEHQMSIYPEGYHAALDRRLGGPRATESITEIYVPRDALEAFFADTRRAARAGRWNIVYGTVRLIERDDESVLAWAREPWACVIFNLHVEHTPAGLRAAQSAFRGLIDLAIRHRGSYFPTYHRYATREQVLACHPRLPELLREKRRVDPDERFQSEWYRHYRRMFA